jgi:hypothetical protein
MPGGNAMFLDTVAVFFGAISLVAAKGIPVI